MSMWAMGYTPNTRRFRFPHTHTVYCHANLYSLQYWSIQIHENSQFTLDLGLARRKNALRLTHTSVCAVRAHTIC